MCWQRVEIYRNLNFEKSFDANASQSSLQSSHRFNLRPAWAHSLTNGHGYRCEATEPLDARITRHCFFTGARVVVARLDWLLERQCLQFRRYFLNLSLCCLLFKLQWTGLLLTRIERAVTENGRRVPLGGQRLAQWSGSAPQRRSSAHTGSYLRYSRVHSDSIIKGARPAVKHRACY